MSPKKKVSFLKKEYQEIDEQVVQSNEPENQLLTSLKSKLEHKVNHQKEFYNDLEEEFFRINDGKFCKFDDPELYK